MSIDIQQINGGMALLGGFLTDKATTEKALADALANQKVANDAVDAARIADQFAQQRITDEVNWLKAMLSQDPNAGPDPGARPHIVHTDPIPK